MHHIRVKGANAHNLKNVDVDIPRDRLTVITGLSGSGKSSLAFDTVYAEGQRRYVESLSSYARQFLEMMEKPDVDHIEGLSPAISIEQKSASHNPRSTVGTVTEIHDYLRLLFARTGIPHCPTHGNPLESQSVGQIADSLLRDRMDQKVMLLAPVVIERKGEYHDLFREHLSKGFIRARVDGKIYDLEDVPPLSKRIKHTVEIVVDRLRVSGEARQRVLESIETAVGLAGGRLHVLAEDMGAPEVFSTEHSCPACGYSPPELEPKLFSFNNPHSACPKCMGLGTEEIFDPGRIIVDPGLSLEKGAISGWDPRNAYSWALLQGLADHMGFRLTTPLGKLPAKALDAILYGIAKPIRCKLPGRRQSTALFEGIVNNIERRYHETTSAYVREELGKYRVVRECAACGGARLAPPARAVLVGGRSISDIGALSLHDLKQFFESLQFDRMREQIAERILKELRERVGFLVDVGLDYLTLSRSANTLSGGEAQRIRLASQIGSGLTGVTYVLDEPSIGLHAHDNERLLRTLFRLRDLQNTVIVVEHDEEAIRRADHIIDMGLEAGVHGGEVVASGPPAEVEAHGRSLTGSYLRGERRIEVPASRKRGSGQLVVRGARGNNLRGIDVAFPLGVMTCVTGVSGSGKSTLVKDILYRALAREVWGSLESPLEHDSISGLESIDKVVNVDQAPIGRTPRSNPATYTGMFTPIRELFSMVPLARERGYKPGRFSFNVPGGRCERCQGDGVVRIEMHFLPDVYVKCETCQGRRYSPETLEVRYGGRTVHDVLEMTVEEALAHYERVPAVRRRLQTLLDVGLGYVKLGQSAPTFSGGEAQRVKLALELSKRDTGGTVYVLDEPTTGLHFHDIKLLLGVLRRLTDDGNTVVVIEHNMDVIKTADWIVDLGPRGGAAGGGLVACGTPEEVAGREDSLTGQHLAKALAAQPRRRRRRAAALA